MEAEATIMAYYDALEAGDPVHPFFADEGLVTKVGISEFLRDPDAVAQALQDQTARTSDWHVVSRSLDVTRNGTVAWFADRVDLAWTDTVAGTRHEFDTRWTGTLVRDDQWQFVTMHVSAPHDF